MSGRIRVLDQGYVELVEAWGSDQGIVEAARMSTGKGFKGWGVVCSECGYTTADEHDAGCSRAGEPLNQPGDEKLLEYLWKHHHDTPFEMAGMQIEVKAPIFVFREWHRHRTQSYNEASARYAPLPDENYKPDVQLVYDRANDRTKNKQAQGSRVGQEVSQIDIEEWLQQLEAAYQKAQEAYETALEIGIPKELARLSMPVARYSRMRAQANLRNWVGFLRLRTDPAAQWEIRQYATAVAALLSQRFPRTMVLFAKEKPGV